MVHTVLLVLVEGSVVHTGEKLEVFNIGGNASPCCRGRGRVGAGATPKGFPKPGNFLARSARRAGPQCWGG